MTGLTRRDAARSLAATAIVALAGVSAEAGTVDPVFGLIAKANEARTAYNKEAAKPVAMTDEILDSFLTPVWEAVAACAPVAVAGFLAKVRFLASLPDMEVSEEGWNLVRLGEDAARLAGVVS